MFVREVVCIVVVGYIVDHYCFMFDRGVVHIVVAVILLTITVFHVSQRSGSYCCGCYIVDHYCFMFDRGVVHIVVAVILLTITVSCLTEKWFVLLWLVILLTITVSCLTEEWFILLWLLYC